MIGPVVGLFLSALGWLASQWVARSLRPRRLGALVMDAGIPLLIFAIALGLAGRPVFAGIVSLSLVGGFAFADWGKRAVLREPVVFTDMSELAELVRHPHLYLPYVGTGRVVAGAAAAAALVIGLLALERPLTAWRWSTPFVTAAAVAALLVLCLGPLLRPAVALFRRWPCTGDPVADSAALGPLAMQFVYGMTARSERLGRRALVRPLPSPARGGRVAPPSVILVQSESFFDPRRLDPALHCALPAFDEACRKAFAAGLMEPPSWGANTVRTEFEVLTGASRTVTGLDWFNPYHQFARARLPSLAWTLKAEGYRTVCLHPFDGGFYGRREVLSNLGFDQFLDQSAFMPPMQGRRYVTDAELARVAQELLQDGVPTFLFLITIENHGPWPDPTFGPAGEGPDAALMSYIDGVRNSDEMIRLLLDGARSRSRGDVLALYGDHLPSLGPLFEARGFTCMATDYFVWSEALPAGPRRDLKACDLPATILEALGRQATAF